MVRLGNLQVEGSATVIASKILMQWQARTNLGVGTATVQASGFIAWDSQLVDDSTWTTQTVD